VNLTRRRLNPTRVMITGDLRKMPDREAVTGGAAGLLLALWCRFNLPVSFNAVDGRLRVALFMRSKRRSTPRK
jgi:hypothetical protein